MTNVEIIRSLIAENKGDSGLTTDRVWIASLLSLIPMVTDIAPEHAATALIDGHRAGHWHLTRCDLVAAAPKGAVKASEITYLGNAFHFAGL